MKQAIRCSKSLLSRQNKEKKKTPASPTYPCRTPTRFLGKTTVSCQGLADNLNLPVQSNHQTQQNKQHRSKPFFFSRCRACPTEEEAQHPIKCLYKAMYNVEGNKCLQEQSLWRLKKKKNEEDSAMTTQSQQCLHIYIYIYFFAVFLPDFSHWQLFCNANWLHLNFWQPPPERLQMEAPNKNKFKLSNLLWTKTI